MDDYKRHTFMDYDAWDIRCPFVCRRRDTRRKLIKIFKRKARRKMKLEAKAWER